MVRGRSPENDQARAVGGKQRPYEGSSASASIEGGMSRPRALAVASGDKDVALATAPVNVTHPELVRRLAWDIPLKNI